MTELPLPKGTRTIEQSNTGGRVEALEEDAEQADDRWRDQDGDDGGRSQEEARSRRREVGTQSPAR